jgi:undecaprenyl-diphosphatase
MVLLNKIHQTDLRLLLWCHRYLLGRRLRTAARITSKTGDGYLQLAFILFACWLDKQTTAAYFLTVLTAFGCERSLYWGLKNSLKRKRPACSVNDFKASIEAGDEFSFPSGHTSAAFLLATMASQILPVVSPLFYLWAGAVGISRVLLGVHFPADIVAGACLGYVIASSLSELPSL